MLHVLRLMLSVLMIVPCLGWAESADPKNSAPGHEDQTLIFVSLAMPEASLKSLYQEAEQAGAVLVLRGLKNNSFKQTIHALQALGVALQINPALFVEYAIESVPTFVRVSGSEISLLKGNVSLSYALERFEEQ